MKSEAALSELIGRMRSLEPDHAPDGWPAVQMRDITALCDAVVESNTRTIEFAIHANALAAALDGYQDSCGEDHPRPKFDCPTCGEEEKVLVAYREFIRR